MLVVKQIDPIVEPQAQEMRMEQVDYHNNLIYIQIADVLLDDASLCEVDVSLCEVDASLCDALLYVSFYDVDVSLLDVSFYDVDVLLYDALLDDDHMNTHMVFS